jgi:hypothetical protein
MIVLREAKYAATEENYASVVSFHRHPRVLLRGVVCFRGDCFPITTIARVGAGATSLQSIFIPRSIESLAPSCFDSFAYLVIVAFASQSAVRVIPQSAFRYSDLRAFFIPRSVETIEKSAFMGCRRLAEITFEPLSSVAALGKSAFSFSGLFSVVIPAAVTEIGPSCFVSCTALATVHFEQPS